MSQKVNPVIFRLGKTQKWKFKYLTGKLSETASYTVKNLEIYLFTSQFFENNGLTVCNCKICYINDSLLHLYVAYYNSKKSVFIIRKINEKQHVVMKKKISQTLELEKQLYKTMVKKIKKFSKYKRFDYNAILNQHVTKNNRVKINKLIKKERGKIKVRRSRLLKPFKNYLLTKNYNNIAQLKNNSFFNFFFESLSVFVGETVKIFLTIKQLNKSLKFNFKKEHIASLKNEIIKMKKYNQNAFFREGIGSLFSAVTKENSENLIANYLKKELRKLKKHNFFIEFIATALNNFLSMPFSNVLGIKIQIKGRFNGAPRAKCKNLTMGKGVRAVTLTSPIKYTEEASHTSDGTFGIKVWVYRKNNIVC